MKKVRRALEALLLAVERSLEEHERWQLTLGPWDLFILVKVLLTSASSLCNSKVTPLVLISSPPPSPDPTLLNE